MKGRVSSRSAILWAALAVLAGCGGGDDLPPVTGKAEGAYAGTLTNSSSTRFQMLVLENDEAWMFYGATLGGALDVAGVIQGPGLSNNGSFRSSTARDFAPSAAAADANVAATYVPDVSIEGSISVPGGPVTFAGTPLATSTYDYDTAATLAAVSGPWSLVDLNNVTSAVTINATTGAITSTSGCAVTAATLTPRSSGKNVFNLVLTFGAGTCTLAGETIRGVGIVETLSGGGKQLILGGILSDRSAGTVLTGTK
jgi:hypothetical protein